MVDKTLELVQAVSSKGCDPRNAFVIVVCFTAAGLLAGFFIGSYLTP
jgi:hypothetical protein